MNLTRLAPVALSIILATILIIFVIRPQLNGNVKVRGDAVDKNASELHNRLTLSLCSDIDRYIVRRNSEGQFHCYLAGSTYVDNSERSDGCLDNCGNVTSCAGVVKSGIPADHIRELDQDIVQATIDELKGRICSE